MEACDENVGPSTYDQLDAFKSLTKLPCYTLIVSDLLLLTLAEKT
jgi:hypothetical protein